MNTVEHEPRWPALIALCAIAGIYTALPASLALGPRWVLPALVLLLEIPTFLSYKAGHPALNRVLGFAVSGVMTAALLYSLALLIHALPAKTESPEALMRSAVALWTTNIIVFAVWYWRLDGGGPAERDASGPQVETAFLFPQLTAHNVPGCDNWSPQFVDYLFLAFNTSTAFSPTDTPVLSRWAKVLTMLQAGISLVIVAVLVSRAIGLL